MKKIWTKLLGTLSVGVLFYPITAYALSTPKLTPLSSGTLGDTVGRIIDFILWLAGALIVIYLIYGGIIYITAAGSEDKIKVGKAAVINAIIGLVVVFLALMISAWVRRALQGLA